jgi:hypothetical protein
MSVDIANATSQSASGFVTQPTKVVISCYFQGGDGRQYPATTINNNDPVPGQWYATDFATKPRQASYTLYAMGNDDPPQHPSGEVDGVFCA